MRRKTLACVISILFHVLAAGAADIVVTNPAAGVNWCQGNEYLITWTISGRMDRNVKIHLRTDRVVLVISASTENDGNFLWRVPDTLTPGNYTIRVRTLDNLVRGDSAVFGVCSAYRQAPTGKIDRQPATLLRTMNIPVQFRTEEKHREKHQWNCLMTLGAEPVPSTFAEFKVGYIHRCIDGGPGCAEQCRSQAFRARPLFDAASLRPLVGKTIERAVLDFRHRSNNASGVIGCNMGLKEARFYVGPYEDSGTSPSEVRSVGAVSPGFGVRIDITEMMRNWLREEDPSYRGEQHNYTMVLVGHNESLDYGNIACLSVFDRGTLYIEYRD